jgi:hypothetical protein
MMEANVSATAKVRESKIQRDHCSFVPTNRTAVTAYGKEAANWGRLLVPVRCSYRLCTARGATECFHGGVAFKARNYKAQQHWPAALRAVRRLGRLSAHTESTSGCSRRDQN